MIADVARTSQTCRQDVAARPLSSSRTASDLERIGIGTNIHKSCIRTFCEK